VAEDRHAKAAEQARRELEHLREETGLLGTSSMVRATRRAQAHFSGADAPQNDPAEIWGRRIGRALAASFVVVLLWWLAATYVFA
jgi:hypothetical protein